MRLSSQHSKPYGSMSLLEFQATFPDQFSCYRYLFAQFWPDGFVCPYCAGSKAWFLPSRRVYECSSCARQISLTAGTVFHKSKVPLHLWFWMIFLTATDKKGCSALNAKRLLGIGSYRTAWMMGQKIRHAMMERDRAYSVGGTVEVDESYYGGKKKGGKRGRGTTKQPVLIVCENRSGRPGFAAMTVLESIDAEEVGSALRANVRPGSRLRTDGLQTYRSAVKQDYEHERQVIDGDQEKTSDFLGWAHVLASNSKRYLLSTHHGVGPKYLTRYLAEFMYRYNRRHWQDQLFERALFACLTAEPAPEKKLTQSSHT